MSSVSCFSLADLSHPWRQRRQVSSLTIPPHACQHGLILEQELSWYSWHSAWHRQLHDVLHDVLLWRCRKRSQSAQRFPHVSQRMTGNASPSSWLSHAPPHSPLLRPSTRSSLRTQMTERGHSQPDGGALDAVFRRSLISSESGQIEDRLWVIPTLITSRDHRKENNDQKWWPNIIPTISLIPSAIHSHQDQWMTAYKYLIPHILSRFLSFVNWCRVKEIIMIDCKFGL